MSYPTVARVVALILALAVVGSTGPAGAAIQATTQHRTWSAQAPEWLTQLLKGGKPKAHRPRPHQPGPPPGEEGPGTCPSGFTDDDDDGHWKPDGDRC